jgi:Spondin_N
MKHVVLHSLLAAAALAALPVLPAAADDGEYFEVTVTNLTRDQRFTPIMVASHKSGVRLFELGAAASPELATLAEEGNTTPIKAALLANPRVLEATDSGALLDPGASVTVRVRTRGGFDRISVASMLIPTNDAFIALNGVRGPDAGKSSTHTSVAYDSGSERNDETCASIPGPDFAECGGPGGGGAPAGGEEGFVHVHSGIHGIGDLDAAQRDWRNPTASIVIRRVAH